jgi:hypothetical protein
MTGVAGEPPPAAPPGEERVSLLVGDRLCIGCGYNLTGQPVVREAHYRMLIVRCPECAAVACLQEYPALGRWAGRWAALLAALWLIVLVAAAVGTGVVMASLATGIGGSAAAPWAERLAARHVEALIAQSAQGPVSRQLEFVMREPVTMHSMLQRGWIDGQDVGALLSDAGGWRAVSDAGALLSWFWVAMLAIPIGCFWGVALLHVRRRHLPVAAVALMVLAALFLVVIHVRSGEGWRAQGWVPAIEAARPGVAVPYEVATLAFSLVALSGGLLLGRPIVRGLARGLLPPRLRGGLALLWIADGLPPPRPGGGAGRR